MVRNQTKPSYEPSTKNRNRVVIIGVLLALVLAFDLTPFGGNIRFYAKWVECGQKPVGTRGSGFLNAGAVHYVEPPVLALGRPYDKYFCTPLEAEQAGYSANPHTYEFPHITKAREEGLIP